MTDLTPHSSCSAILTVADVVDETADARSIVFDVPAAMADKFTAYKPGQFLTLRIPSEETGSVARCYSLASSPVSESRPGHGQTHRRRLRLQLGVRQPHHRIMIEALPPSGVFTPADLDAPLLLIAAGSGVTPVMSILKTALAAGNGRSCSSTPTAARTTSSSPPNCAS